MGHVSFSNIIAGIVFGSVGFVAFIYGKKQARIKTMLIGAALIVVPYIITDTLVLAMTGAILTAGIFIFRD